MNIERKIIFIIGNEELILPVTPESFAIVRGINIETLNIHGVGDIRIAGYSTLDNVKIESFFPAQEYNFSVAAFTDPYALAGRFASLSANRTVVRWIVTGTDINIPVFIESIEYGESGGSNDVEYVMTLSEYRYISTTSSSNSVALPVSTERAVETEPETPSTYTVVAGDCLRNISRKFYGTQAQYKEIAAINGIKNPDLIFPGQVLTLP